jgi:hypothetical protein
MNAAVSVFSLLLLPLASCAATCGGLEKTVEQQVSMLDDANDDLGPFRSIGDESLQALKQCPDSARLWYLAARSAEVLEGPMDGKAFAESGGLKKILANARLHAPKSAAIATIAARLDGGVPLAREALAFDSSYAPARRALVSALVKNGFAQEAMPLTSSNSRVDADHLARARVLLGVHRPAEAVAEARKALEPGGRDPVEPAPRIEIRRDANEVLGFALLEEHHADEAHRALLVAGDAGSITAKQKLANWK